MTLQLIVFIVLLFTTIYNLGVQVYIHQEAYPLIGFVGKAEFVTYLSEYEKRLTLPLLIPYALTVLSNLALIVMRPDAISLIAVIIVLVLNMAVAVVTMVIATPVYNQIKQAGTASGAEMERLMQINMIRLGLSAAASAVVVVMLITLLSV